MDSAGLTLHPEKTRIVNVDEPGGFDFLGCHFERGYRWPRQRSLKKFKDAIRAKTRRTHGHSLSAIVADVNRTTRGWFGYFQPCPESRRNSHWTTFGPLDQWLRMRLRSILRRRIKLRGRGRGADHQRRPNVYFAAAGLFTIPSRLRARVEAYRQARQSVAAH